MLWNQVSLLHVLHPVSVDLVLLQPGQHWLHRLKVKRAIAHTLELLKLPAHGQTFWDVIDIDEVLWLKGQPDNHQLSVWLHFCEFVHN